MQCSNFSSPAARKGRGVRHANSTRRTSRPPPVDQFDGYSRVTKCIKCSYRWGDMIKVPPETKIYLSLRHNDTPTYAHTTRAHCATSRDHPRTSGRVNPTHRTYRIPTAARAPDAAWPRSHRPRRQNGAQPPPWRALLRLRLAK